MENDKENTLSPEVLERIRSTPSYPNNQSEIHWGRIFFYAFILGIILVAFYGGYSLGRIIEKERCEKLGDGNGVPVI